MFFLFMLLTMVIAIAILEAVMFLTDFGNFSDFKGMIIIYSILYGTFFIMKSIYEYFWE